MVPRASSLTLAGLILTFTASCGGSGVTTTSPTPTPLPTPTPVPQPTPSPSPSPDCVPGGDCPGNTTPVVRAVLRLYRLFDNLGGWVLPTPVPKKGVFQEKFPVGFILVLDVTGRDAQGRETNGIKGDGSGIEWVLDPPSLVEFSGDPAGPFQHKYRLLQPGTLKVYVGFDGVGSNDLTFDIVPCTPPDWGCKPPP